MRERPGHPDPAAVRAAAPHGVIRARTLVALGLPESTVYDRCRDGGPWQLLAPGIVLTATGRPTEEQVVAAALLHGGPHAMITGLHACRRHGIRRGPALPTMLHVLVPHARQVRNTDLMHVERTSRLPRPHLRRGIPLAPVPRAVADAVRRLRSKADVAELVSDAVQRKLCTVAQLSAELDDGGRRGSATPRRVLLDVRAGVRSAAEADARKLWRRSGLPEPWWNAHVHDAGGRLLGVVDAWWDDVALACEINSYEWHLAPEDYAREQEKLAGLTALGVIVLPTLPTRMRGRADEVLRELGSAYAAAQARPRPDVRARTVDLRRAWWSAPPAGRRGGARAGRR